MPMALALLMVLVVSAPGRALAAPIAPGFDLFTTPDGTAFIDLTGSPLGVGVVDLIGNPIPGEPGGADTIVERLTGLGNGQIGTIDIELVALHNAQTQTGTRKVNKGGVVGRRKQVEAGCDRGGQGPARHRQDQRHQQRQSHRRKIICLNVFHKILHFGIAPLSAWSVAAVPNLRCLG